MAISFLHSGQQGGICFDKDLHINYTNTHIYTHTMIRMITQIWFFFLLLQGIFRDKGTVTEKWSIYICDHFRGNMSCEGSMYGFEFIWKREACLFWFQRRSGVQKWNNTINPQQQHGYNLYVNVNSTVTPSLAVDISDSGQQIYVVES